MTFEEAKKLKVGDKVKLNNIPNESVFRRTSVLDWGGSERPYAGKVVTIKKIKDSIDYPGEYYFKIEEDDVPGFYAHMIEKKVN